MPPHESWSPHGTGMHRGRRFDDDPRPTRSRRPAPRREDDGDPDAPPAGYRWSTWDTGQRAPAPHPPWLVTELAAVDIDLGVLKTGEEGRRPPRRARDARRASRGLLAAERYRSAEHRMFSRDAAYIEGRRVRRFRETRAMARRTAFGRDLLAGQWAAAEFAALVRLHGVGAPVPYPVQLLGTEVLLEYLEEDDGRAAPRPAAATRRAARPEGRAARRAGPARRRGARARRPLPVHPAGAPRPAGAHRPVAGGRRGGRSTGSGVPGPRRPHGVRLVRRPGPAPEVADAEAVLRLLRP